jgi:hypothetical protein
LIQALRAMPAEHTVTAFPLHEKLTAPPTPDGVDVVRTVHALTVMLIGVFATPVFAQITKNVDEKGRVTYSDKPAAGSAAKGGQTVNAAPASGQAPPPQKKGVPLAVQPKNHVPGDPLIDRMHENEERRVRERVTAECWRQKSADCTDEWAIKEMVAAERKAQAAKEPKPKPAVREPLPADFCQRNPRVEACQPAKPAPDVTPPPDKPPADKPAPKK